MSRRKDELRALLSGGAPPKPDTSAPDPKSESAPVPDAGVVPKADEAPKPVRGHTSSGAVKAMGLALGTLRSDAEDARQLRESVSRGERVVELDPASIEPAFVADRLTQGGEGDEQFETLKASIAEGGQQVPILVRPHPDADQAKAGRYQAAYGHRRIAATRALGLKVRALVKPLSDRELVLAQGQENSERRDLSFIERALFSKALLDRGFERAVVQSALSLHKAEMTRLLQVAEAVPGSIARAVGPAPKAGRTRWMALADLLQSEAARGKATDEIGTDRFRAASSDERFTMLLDRLTRKSAKAAEGRTPEAVLTEGGERIAALRRSGARPQLEFERGAGGFADFVAAELPALYAAYLARRDTA